MIGVKIVKLWLETPFKGGRHARQVDKITKYRSGPTAVFDDEPPR